MQLGMKAIRPEKCTKFLLSPLYSTTNAVLGDHAVLCMYFSVPSPYPTLCRHPLLSTVVSHMRRPTSQFNRCVTTSPVYYFYRHLST